LTNLYKVVGSSRQALKGYQKRSQKEADQWLLLQTIVSEWRTRHPAMSLTKIYNRIQPNFIGQNKFVRFGMLYGFEPAKTKKSIKTTIPVCTRSYPNLLYQLIINDVNQVWVSDITYFRLKGKWVYIVLIMDLYSRRIIGCYWSKNMFATANLEALKIAFKNRKCRLFKNQLIHHSDRGSQYNSLLYTGALNDAQILISMGRIVYDNVHMERAIQTIKNEYLIHRSIQSPIDLSTHLKKDVRLYNTERPHIELGRKTPVEFERYICNIPLCQRTPLRVFALNTKKALNNEQNIDINQLTLPF